MHEQLSETSGKLIDSWKVDGEPTICPQKKGPIRWNVSIRRWFRHDLTQQMWNISV